MDKIDEESESELGVLAVVDEGDATDLTNGATNNTWDDATRGRTE